jgi:hypothetical protein
LDLEAGRASRPAFPLQHCRISMPGNIAAMNDIAMDQPTVFEPIYEPRE